MNDNDKSRQQLLAELQEMRAQMAMAQSLAALGTWEWNLRTRTATLSAEKLRIAGLPHDATYPEFLSRIHPADLPGMTEAIRAAIERRGTYDVEARLVLPDGHVRYVVCRGRVELGEDGEPHKLIGVIQDITERKRTEEELLRRNALLRAQQEADIDGVLVVDEHQRMVSYNQRFVQLWGVPEAMLRVGDDRAVVAHVANQLRDPRAFLDKVGALYQHPLASSRDELEMKDGRVIDRYSAPAISPQGQFFGRVWYFRDITELKLLEAALKAKNERLQELNRVQSNFVHSVSHELRTPLTSIVGYAEFLEDCLEEAGRSEWQEYILQIQLSAQRLQRLLDDLQDFALLEAGTFKLKPVLADLAVKIREIAESFRPQVEKSHLRLELALPSRPLVLVADPQRVGQVLANLIANAVKMTSPDGRIQVRAEVEGDRLRVEVADTGPGINQEDIPRLFQRFSQLEGGVRRGGTGLGLSISKALIEAHGGEVGVESQVGQGSIFWFTLPLAGPGAV